MEKLIIIISVLITIIFGRISFAEGEITFEGSEKEFNELYKCNVIDNTEICKNKKTNELLYGEIIKFYENGNTKEEGIWVNGKRDYESYYYKENGSRIKKITYKDGKKDGELVYFYENGNPLVKGMYKNDNKYGEWVFYYKSYTIKLKAK